MKIKYFFSRIFTAMVCIPLLLASCSESSPEIINDGDDDEDDAEDVMSNVDFLADYLVQSLCAVDSVGDTEILTPRYGKVLNESLPTDLTCSMKDEAAAMDFFQHTLSDFELAEELYSGDAGRMVYDLGEYGKITYTTGDGVSEIARISFDVPRLKNTMRSLTIVTPQAWPENNTSPYAVGDVLCETVNGKKYYWLVVREYQGGVDGIMMTVDTGWWTEHREDHYKSFDSYRGCAGKDAWDALSQWWFDDERDFRQELRAIQEIEKSNGARLGWITDLFTRTIEGAKTGKEEYQYGNTWDNKYYWWAKVRNVWEARSYYVKLGVRESNNSTRFKSDSYYFKRNWSVVFPKYRNSSSRYFQSDRNNQLSNHYRIIYPEW